MSEVERRIVEFEQIIRQIILQFKQVNSSMVCGPHMNLGPHDVAIIELLGETGPQMMRLIAERLGLAVNSVTPIVDSLEVRGFVQRLRSETDRRVINVVLTEQGAQAFNTASRLKAQFHRTMLKALSSGEQETFLKLFKKIADAGASDSGDNSVHPVVIEQSLDSAARSRL